jgi:hypothetical protein
MAQTLRHKRLLTPDIAAPFIASWCIRCISDDDIKTTKMGTVHQLGDIKKMQRITPANEVLSWQIAITREQILASNGQIPFLIKWDDFSFHPTKALKEENFCKFALTYSGLNAEIHKNNLQQLGFEIADDITFKYAPHESILLNLHYQKNSLIFNRTLHPTLRPREEA